MPLVALSFASARRSENGRVLGDRTTTDLAVKLLGLGRDVARGIWLRTLFAIGLFDRLELIAGRGGKLVTLIPIPTTVVRSLTPRRNPLLDEEMSRSLAAPQPNRVEVQSCSSQGLRWMAAAPT